MLGSDRLNEPLGDGVRSGRAGWRVDHVDSVSDEDLVEGGDEHRCVAADQEPGSPDPRVGGVVARGQCSWAVGAWSGVGVTRTGRDQGSGFSTPGSWKV